MTSDMQTGNKRSAEEIGDLREASTRRFAPDADEQGERKEHENERQLEDAVPDG